MVAQNPKSHLLESPFMNDTTQIKPDETKPTTTQNRIPDNMNPDFTSIDDPNIKWPCFELAMLRAGRILTRRTLVRREISAKQISSVMERHRDKVGAQYKPKEIRELFGNYGCYFTGGGIRVEGQQVSEWKRSVLPHYTFTFSRILRPEDYAMPETEGGRNEAQI
jgi:hypothetical protein